jgi:hypothetical protein
MDGGHGLKKREEGSLMVFFLQILSEGWFHGVAKKILQERYLVYLFINFPDGVMLCIPHYSDCVHLCDDSKLKLASESRLGTRPFF